MLNSKLTKTIQVFSKDELVRFAQFLKSPYFVKDKQAEEIIKLFNVISKSLKRPASLEKKLLLSNVHKAIYGKIPFNPGQMEKLKTKLFKLVEQFIIYEYSDTNRHKTRQLLNLSTFYEEKGLQRQFSNNQNKIKKNLQQRKIHDAEYFLEQFLFQQVQTKYMMDFEKRIGDLNIQNTLEAFQQYFLLVELKFSRWLLSQKVQVKLNTPSNNYTFNQAFNEDQNPLKTMKHLNNPILHIYDKANWILKYHEIIQDSDIKNFIKMLDENEDKIERSALNDFHTLLRIHVTHQINLGQTEYLMIAFELFKKQLQKGFLYHSGKIHYQTLQNISLIAHRLKEYDWVYNFLQEHQQKITGVNNPEEIYQFNLAIYHFETQNYEKALNLLKNHYEDLYQKIIAKRLEIKILYETQSVLLDARIEAFKIYIFRISKQLLPETPKLANNNFINMVRQILNPKTFKNNERIDKLLKIISDKKVMSEKDWLICKIEEQR